MTIQYLEQKELTEYSFQLVRDKYSKYVNILLKYDNYYYSPLCINSGGIGIATINKLLSLKMCIDFIKLYVFKKVFITEDIVKNTIQLISFKKSDITLKIIS